MEEIKQKIVSANWDLKLWIDCPHCDNYFDAMAYENPTDIRESLPEPLERVNGIDIEAVECPKCGKEFTINNLEY